jgi:flagellar basal-body rod modification protein FlgD
MNAVDTTKATNPFAAFAAASGNTKATANATQDRFLTLLVTQLKNQDPTNPLDNAQITSQLAQLSTVTGIEKVGKDIEGLAGRFDGLQTLQAAALVGRQVLVDGSDMDLYQGSARAGFQLTQPVDQLAITIKDSAGRELQRIELGPQQAGLQQFAWDGLTDTGAAALDGRYQFSVEASAAGKPIDVSRLSIARIDGVASATDGFLLSLAGRGNVDLGQVKQIL